MSLFFELGIEQSDLSAVELKNGLFQANTTFRELTYIGWCCIDLSNAPDNIKGRPLSDCYETRAIIETKAMFR